MGHPLHNSWFVLHGSTIFTKVYKYQEFGGVNLMLNIELYYFNKQETLKRIINVLN